MRVAHLSLPSLQSATQSLFITLGDSIQLYTRDMFIPQADHSPASLDGPSSVLLSLPLDKPSRLSFDIAGVAGLVGGDDSISAMSAVHVYGNRQWLGWYNTPGSFEIAKRFDSLVKSVRGGISSRHVDIDPASLCGSRACEGPRFRAAHSGTVIEETGYLASLFMEECAAWDSEGKVVAGRRTSPIGITIADLGQAPATEMKPAYSSPFTILSASIPIATSISACALCATCEDWYASSLIFVGIVASGISCLVLGSADFMFTHPEPAKGAPAGDGILSSDKNIVLLRGTEGVVNSITRGRFSIRFSSQGHHSLIRWCSILFFIQSMSQLLLIPQASLFGQVMFLISLGISALYNAWLSSMDQEKIHRKLLFERVLENPTVTKYTLGTRTTAVVFILLVLQLQDPAKLLDELLPNDTRVWRQWKATILEQLRHCGDKSFLPESKPGDVDGFTQQELDLLELLYDDAWAAYSGYRDYLGIDSL